MQTHIPTPKVNYDVLDTRLVQAVRGGASRFMDLQNAPRIKEEVQRLAEVTKRDTFRVLDGRLQALRRKGTLCYTPHDGWVEKLP